MLDLEKVKFRDLYRSPAVWLGYLAAILYCSWPLGYILNPVVGHHELASQLEASHQPYNWVFIVMDVLVGVLMLVVGLLQARKHHRRVLSMAVWSYVLFGLMVGTAALLPLKCDPTAQACGPLLHDPRIIIHGGLSILSTVFLLVSLVLLGKALYVWVTSWLLRAMFCSLLTCWVLFGIGSLIEMWLRINNNVLQYFFITICSLSIILVVSVTEHLHLKSSRLRLVTNNNDTAA